MKSAYELAMERLNASGDSPQKPLSEEQKTALQAIDTKFQAKLAEREVFLKQQLASAQASEISLIERQIIDEKKRLEEEKEDAKEKLRQSWQ